MFLFVVTLSVLTGSSLLLTLSLYTLLFQLSLKLKQTPKWNTLSYIFLHKPLVL